MCSRESIEIWTKIIGAIGVIAGIFFTGSQISKSNETERAKLIYAIQKDGNALLRELSNDHSFKKCIILSENCNDVESNEAQNGVRIVLQFYSSVNNQRELGQLLPKYWEIWSRETCAFARHQIVRSYWNNLKNKDGYGVSFTKEMDQCVK